MRNNFLLMKYFNWLFIETCVLFFIRKNYFFKGFVINKQINNKLFIVNKQFDHTFSQKLHKGRIISYNFVGFFFMFKLFLNQTIYEPSKTSSEIWKLNAMVNSTAT